MDSQHAKPPDVDPLRRGYFPIEKRTVNGTWVFRTVDGEQYCRAPDGSIRSVTKRVNGKVARKRRRRGH